mmetsp:Transcript_41770/g.96744  ORF Transcript_41770/g.96744 Transcript_41770/m.96744 type:complete len:398 (-) Transcript_41770:79-1272(-)
MPLCIDVKERLFEKSQSVECVDFHPTEPRVLSALCEGTLVIWDWVRQAVVEEVQACDARLRCARFVAREGWIVTASDDMIIRVFDCALAELQQIEAHDDYIRFLAVHPDMPYLLSCSDDSSIKLWDWSQEWQCAQSFEGHTHNVTMCLWEGHESVAFASSSTDKSIKIWKVDLDLDASPESEVSFLGHDAGVNCLAFDSPEGKRTRLASGSEDLSVRVWDRFTGQCLRCLTGHSCNVTAVVFHPTEPVLLTGSEDRTVQMWNTETFDIEETWDRHLDRVCSLAVGSASDALAVGHALGTTVVELRVEAAMEVRLEELQQGADDGIEVLYRILGCPDSGLVALQVDAGQRLVGLRAQLVEHLEVPQRKLKLSLPCGRRLGEADGSTPLDVLLKTDSAG